MKTVKNFSLFQRGDKWYMRFKSTDGKLMAKSVDKLAEAIGWEGQIPVEKKKEADQVCLLAMEKGVHDTAKKQGVTVEQYLTEWWDFEGDRIRRKNALNPNSISIHYASIMAINIRKHVVPYLPKNLLLSDVSPEHVKAVSDHLVDSTKIARGTIVKIMQAFTSPLKMAWKQGLVSEDPTRFLDSIDASGKKRGIPTQKEFSLLIDELERNAKKTGDRHTLLVVKLAASTGMRLGEIIALGRSAITLGDKASKISIVRSWSVMGGFKSPKGKRSRETYIPTSLANELIALCESNPNYAKIKKGEDPLVFWSIGGKESVPVSEKYIRSRYTHCLDLALCASTGVTYRRISDKIKKGSSIRIERNIGIHSLRHMYITRAGSSIGDEALLRQVVGHANEAMTDRYTHVDEGKAMPLVSIGKSILGE